MFLNDLYLPEEELCMAEILKAEGYNTACLGKWHLDGHIRENNVEPERRQGFDYWEALEILNAHGAKGLKNPTMEPSTLSSITAESFKINEDKLIFPIPVNELYKNPNLLPQNGSYQK